MMDTLQFINTKISKWDSKKRISAIDDDLVPNRLQKLGRKKKSTGENQKDAIGMYSRKSSIAAAINRKICDLKDSQVPK